MKKVIAITCHKVTNPLIHTVKYLSSFDANTIIIHVDSKSNLDDFLFLRSENVSFVEDRFNIVWGGISQIKATLKLIEFSSNIDFDYFFLISGDDIPIMNNIEMDTFLDKNYGYDFIHYQDTRNVYVEPKERIMYRYPKSYYKRTPTFYERAIKIIFSYTKNIFFKNKSYTQMQEVINFYKGTNWFTLTKSSIKYIELYLVGNPRYLDLFERSLCADEVFFHTILKTKMDLKIYSGYGLLNDALRYIDWVSGPEYPKVLNNTDREKINKNYFFARKIRSDESFDFMHSFL